MKNSGTLLTLGAAALLAVPAVAKAVKKGGSKSGSHFDSDTYRILLQHHLDLPGMTDEDLRHVAEYADWEGRWVDAEWDPASDLLQVLQDVDEYMGNQYPDLGWSIQHGHWHDWLKQGRNSDRHEKLLAEINRDRRLAKKGGSRSIKAEDIDDNYAYLDRENSALCADCARKSASEDEVPQFRPVSKFPISSATDGERCDQCFADLNPDAHRQEDHDEGYEDSTGKWILPEFNEDMTAAKLAADARTRGENQKRYARVATTSKTTGKKRFGKARVAGCECTYGFTCRACLDAAHAKQKNR